MGVGPIRLTEGAKPENGTESTEPYEAMGKCLARGGRGRSPRKGVDG